MTDEQIIRGLEHIVEIAKDIGDVHSMMINIGSIISALDLINRQKEEIERLKKSRDNLYEEMVEKQKEEVNIARRMGKAEAYREFAERLNALFAEYAPYDTLHTYEIKDRIDIVEDELTEKNDFKE